MRSGGKAALFLEPRNPQEAASSLAVLDKEKIPVLYLGGGSNVLAPDSDFDGAVISTACLKTSARQGEIWNLWAGVSLPGIVHDAADAGLTGMEGFVGIPGSIGGAARMNSGGRFGEIWDRIESIEVADPDGSRRTLRPVDLNPSYRNGNLGDSLCLSVTLRLEKGNRKEIQEKTAQVLAQKAAAQPLTERSAGCIFKNPPSQSAGKLVELSGCKGWNEGDAYVSEKHGNFIVNRGKARSADVLRLIERVRRTVLEKQKVELELEIQLWGK